MRNERTSYFYTQLHNNVMGGGSEAKAVMFLRVHRLVLLHMSGADSATNKMAAAE